MAGRLELPLEGEDLVGEGLHLLAGPVGVLQLLHEHLLADPVDLLVLLHQFLVEAGNLLLEEP